MPGQPGKALHFHRIVFYRTQEPTIYCLNGLTNHLDILGFHIAETSPGCLSRDHDLTRLVTYNAPADSVGGYQVTTGNDKVHLYRLAVNWPQTLLTNNTIHYSQTWH